MTSHGHALGRVRAGEEAVAGERGMEWDAVAQASWESFPASDPPGWIGTPPRGGRLPARPKEA